MATTLSDIKKLADSITADDTTRREHLRAMIRHYCHILAVKDADKFIPRALRYMDEPGHWDNSYPPEQQYVDRNGPAMIRIEAGEWDEVATEGGFYYSWEAVTRTRGVYVDRHGDLWGACYSGAGSFGQFAAHPGNCGVDIRIEYSLLGDEETSTDQVAMVESKLRKMTAPLMES